MARRVLRLRTEQGLSQEGLGERAGVSWKTVQTIERARPPSARNLAAIAEALGTTVGDLLGERAEGESELVARIRDLERDLDDRARATLIDLARLEAERARRERRLQQVAEEPGTYEVLIRRVEAILDDEIARAPGEARSLHGLLRRLREIPRDPAAEESSGA